jgi:hypothetical protein
MIDMHQMHKEERSEWRTDANYRQEKTNKAINELSKAINEMISEQRHSQINT